MEKTKKGGSIWREHWMVRLKELGFNPQDLIAQEKKLPLPIQYTDGESWIEYMKRWNRLKHKDQKEYRKGARVIMDNDIGYIVKEADLVIMRYTRSAGSGTLGENSIAYHFKKPVYTVVDDKSLHLKDVGMWVVGACEELDWHLNELVPDLQKFLKNYYIKQAILITKYNEEVKKIKESKENLIKFESDLEIKINEELKNYK